MSGSIDTSIWIAYDENETCVCIGNAEKVQKFCGISTIASFKANIWHQQQRGLLNDWKIKKYTVHRIWFEDNETSEREAKKGKQKNVKRNEDRH